MGREITKKKTQGYNTYFLIMPIFTSARDCFTLIEIGLISSSKNEEPIFKRNKQAAYNPISAKEK